jgi:SAM-dependent methyltransferase
MQLNIGCGPRHHPGYLNIDSREPAELIFDLDNLTGSGRQLPIEEGVVTKIVATHMLEHIRDRLGLIAELYRVAANGCELLIQVPYCNHDDAIDDPTHVAFFGPYTFRFFAAPWWHNNNYGYEGDWEIDKVTMCCHKKYKQKHSQLGESFLDWTMRHRNVCYALHASGRAVKPARAHTSALITLPTIVFDFA